MGAFKGIVDDGLDAGFNAGDVVPVGVDAGLCGVDFDDGLEFLLASLELVLPSGALGFAVFDDAVLGVLTVLEHLLDVAGLGDGGHESLVVRLETKGEPMCDKCHFVSKKQTNYTF